MDRLRQALVISRRGGIVFERSVAGSAADDDLVRIDQSIECRGVLERSVVTVQGARVTDAVLSLLTGSAPLGAGFDAGFGHASRFYEVFRKLTGNTPGDYASIARQKPRRPRGGAMPS
jgi:AraC-like DNA-binding protein